MATLLLHNSDTIFQTRLVSSQSVEPVLRSRHGLPKSVIFSYISKSDEETLSNCACSVFYVIVCHPWTSNSPVDWPRPVSGGGPRMPWHESESIRPRFSSYEVEKRGPINFDSFHGIGVPAQTGWSTTNTFNWQFCLHAGVVKINFRYSFANKNRLQ